MEERRGGKYVEDPDPDPGPGQIITLLPPNVVLVIDSIYIYPYLPTCLLCIDMASNCVAIAWNVRRSPRFTQAGESLSSMPIAYCMLIHVKKTSQRAERRRGSLVTA